MMIKIILVALMVAVCTFPAIGQMDPTVQEDEFEEALVRANRHISVDEVRRLRHLQPLIDYPNIMFWRPQKVGSSTILSLLISFGYRYNIIQRRRSIGSNFVCRKLASCAHADMIRNGVAAFNKTRGNEGGAGIGDMGINNFMETLRMYISGSNWPMLRNDGSIAPVKKSSRGSRQFIQERMSEYLGPYYISSDHNICFLDENIIESYLPCAFAQIDQVQDLHADLGKREGRKALRTPMLDPESKDWNKHLLASFQGHRKQVKELFAVRHPLKRIVSIYYFWGELYRVRNLREKKKKGMSDGGEDTIRIGSEVNHKGVWGDLASRHSKDQERKDEEGYNGNLFRYHGNESTVPSTEVAEEFAERVSLSHGMPGPSSTSSVFAQTIAGTVEVIEGSRIMTIVAERMAESLVVARHFLGWSLADVVVVSPRKALSQHPGYDKWPVAVVDKLRRKLENWGEFRVYEAANRKLDARIRNLEATGKVHVQSEVAVLKALQRKVGSLCLSKGYLHLYRAWMSGKMGLKAADQVRDYVLPVHYSDNKLRDSDHYYSDEGHTFDFNRDKIISYDLCGACEAHAIMHSLPANVLNTTAPIGSAAEADRLVSQGKLLKDISRIDVVDNPHFKHCPVGLAPS